MMLGMSLFATFPARLIFFVASVLQKRDRANQRVQREVGGRKEKVAKETGRNQTLAQVDGRRRIRTG